MEAHMDETIQQQIDTIHTSEAYNNAFHPSHEKAMETISRLYASLYPEEGQTVAPKEVEGATKEAEALKEETLKVDDPEQAAIQEALQPLKDEWRGDYDCNIESAQGMTANLVKEYGIDSAEVFDVIGNHPLVVKNLYEWSQGRPGTDLTAAEAKEVIQLLQNTDAYRSGATGPIAVRIIAAFSSASSQARPAVTR
jgi:hypothetical protein